RLRESCESTCRELLHPYARIRSSLSFGRVTKKTSFSIAGGVPGPLFERWIARGSVCIVEFACIARAESGTTSQNSGNHDGLARFVFHAPHLCCYRIVIWFYSFPWIFTSRYSRIFKRGNQNTRTKQKKQKSGKCADCC